MANNKTRKRRRNYTRDEQVAHLAAFQASGQTRSKYASSTGINPNMLTKWHKIHGTVPAATNGAAAAAASTNGTNGSVTRARGRRPSLASPVLLDLGVPEAELDLAAQNVVLRQMVKQIARLL